MGIEIFSRQVIIDKEIFFLFIGLSFFIGFILATMLREKISSFLKKDISFLLVDNNKGELSLYFLCMIIPTLVLGTVTLFEELTEEPEPPVELVIDDRFKDSSKGLNSGLVNNN